MTWARVVRAELGKALTLPATWAGVGVAAGGSLALTLLNASIVQRAMQAGRVEDYVSSSPVETAFAAMPLGTVGAVVIGVVVMSSEYASGSAEVGGGRQIGATLTAMPRRGRLLAAKAAVVAALVVGVAAVTLPAAIGLARLVLRAGAVDGAVETVGVGDAVLRCAGGTLYWVLTGVLALAITALARSGIVPLLVLVVNSSIVSVSLLLTHVTPLAYWLPDLAGMRLFGGVEVDPGGLDALPGALVMAAWAFGVLLVGALVLRRRDA